MAVALDQFIRRVSESSVMSKDDITALLSALPAEKQPADGEALARILVKEKKLTKYQAEQIYAGKGKSLIIGNNVILDKIGAGGMGQVFKAKHRRMDRLVAIKLLPPEVNKDEAAIQRFHREVKAAAKLTHPNIVIAYDADEAPGGIHFLVMEYVEGRDLAQVANSTTSLPVDTVLNYILQAARGLAFAHSKGVVHRDIKPANLLLDAEGTVKILDMGLARIHDAAVQAAKDGLTKSGDVMGTVDYMAPEQAFDTHKADGRADIYSLGCTMYRLLMKANLYEAESLVQKLMAHQSKPIPSLRQQRPDVSAELEAAFQRMVAKSVEDRFQTMGEVIAALEPLLGASSSSTPVKKEPDSKIKAFFRGLTGGSTKPGNDAPTSALGERVAVVAPASTEPAQTIALSSPLQVTDPVSDRSIAAARTIVPIRNQKKPAGPWWRNRNVMIASGAGGFLLVLLAIWVIIKDKDGKEIARLKVPEGGSSETKEVPELPQEKPPTIQQTLGDPANTTAVATVDNGSRWPFDPNDGQEYTWSKPENLGSGVNTAEDETLAGISQDGLKLYFLRGGQGYFAMRNNLTEAFRDAREFPQVQNVQGFSVSATGRAMVIASTTGAANIDKIWLSLRPDHLSPLGPFELAPPPVNGKDWMIHPVLSGDGSTLLACTDRNDGQWADIWMFTRTKLEAPFTTSERLPAPVNTPDWDIPFLISNDRCFVITGSQREKTDGEPMAKKKPFVRTIRYFTRSNPTEPFGPGHPLSIHLGKLDTSDTNGGFKLGGDRRTLYFESGYRPDSAGGIDLWMSRRVPVSPGARPSSEAVPAVTNPAASPPSLAKAPFNASQAKSHQEAWAKHLGIKVETPNSVGAKMILIPPGEFMMGSSDADIELALKIAEETKLEESGVKRIQEERPQHMVRITKPFRLSAHEVTIGQFVKFIEQSKYKTQAEEFGGNSSTVQLEDVKPENLKLTWRTPGQAVTDDSPVTQVSWIDAVAFCNWLSGQEQLTSCYQRDGGSWTLLPKANGYRLPTEAEWEYACRAGTTTQFWFGDDWKDHNQYGWTNKNAGGRPHSVGSLPANPFGLYDVHGNVWEWCQDWYDGTWYKKSPQNDPLGPSRLSDRVDRGGGWNGIPANSRSSCRSHPTLSDRNYGRGFRVAQNSVVVQTDTASAPPPTVPAAASGKLFMHDPAFSQWLKEVQAMSTEQQIEAVSKKLMELNPGFDGKMGGTGTNGTPSVENGVVTSLELVHEKMTDISPLKAFHGLNYLVCAKGNLVDLSPLNGMRLTTLRVEFNARLTDLTPIQGLPLTTLNLHGSGVSDLRPIKGLPLTQLVIRETAVTDLTPLQGMPLTSLDCLGCEIADLSPLEELPLKRLITPTRLKSLAPLKNLRLNHLEFNSDTITDLSPIREMPLATLMMLAPQLSDLKPLNGMRLTSLSLHSTSVSDLTPLKAMPLKTAVFDTPSVTDLAPLQELPLESLNFTVHPSANTELLRSNKTLQRINDKPAAEFWKEFDEQQKGKKLGFQMPGFELWVKEVQAMSAEKQIEAVRKKLMELNLGFDGKFVGYSGSRTPAIENNVITEMRFSLRGGKDISPIKALNGLKKLSVPNSNISDLSPLLGMNITQFNGSRMQIADLSPLQKAIGCSFYC